MEPALRVALEAVHASPVRAVMHVTGGAAQSLGWVMAVPGASRTLLEARVPYAREAMVDLLGKEPAQYVDARCARRLARAAYARGVRLSPPSGDDARHVVGLGCTCALASVPPKKGAHRCVVATFGLRGAAEYSLVLEKDARDRWEEDGLASRLVVHALAEAAELSRAASRATESADKHSPSGTDRLEGDLLAPHLVPGDALETNFSETLIARAGGIEYSPSDDHRSPGDKDPRTRSRVPFEWLARGDGELVELTDGEVTAADALPGGAFAKALVLPGSFNPLHDGHRGMLAAALKLRAGHRPAFELAVTNADKGTMPVEEVMRRAEQFRRRSRSRSSGDGGSDARDLDLEEEEDEGFARLILTRSPLFSGKAALMPGATFVVGHDTAVRLVMPKYYGGEAGMLRAFAAIRERGCSFLVAGRLAAAAGDDDATGARRFLTLADVDVPAPLRDLFEEIPGFREDVSSTEIRAEEGRE